jgi:hypothetical protein
MAKCNVQYLSELDIDSLRKRKRVSGVGLSRRKTGLEYFKRFQDDPNNQGTIVVDKNQKIETYKSRSTYIVC